MHELKRFILFKFLTDAARERAESYPQFATFLYDTVGISAQTNGYYEHFHLAFLRDDVFPRLAARRICLDIGANIGNHSVFFADTFDQVISFEPHPRTFKLLEANAMLRSNIRSFNFGLSSRDETLSASFNARNVGATSLRGSDDAGDSSRIDLKLRRLDDLPEVSALDALDFIKIDIEGHEVEALTGAEATLKKHRPVIAMEVLAEEIRNGSAASIELLKRFGYGYFYTAQDNRPMATRSIRLARFLNAVQVLILGRRIDKKLSLVAFEQIEAGRDHPMIICSFDPL